MVCNREWFAGVCWFRDVAFMGSFATRTLLRFSMDYHQISSTKIVKLKWHGLWVSDEAKLEEM